MNEGSHRSQLSSVPLYVQVRDLLEKRVVTKEWASGTAIPKEPDLARELGVSVGTVRKALDSLETEGLITRKQGRGTFVTDWSRQSVVGRYTQIFTVHGERILGDVRVLSFQIAQATDKERSLLRTYPGADVYRFTRTRSYQGTPFLVEEVVVPVALFPDVSEAEWRSRWFAELAPDKGVFLGASVETAAPAQASAFASETLGIPVGTAVLVLERLIKTRDGQPAEWRRAEFHPRQLRYRVDSR